MNIKWEKSDPFDIGNTCRTAFSINPEPGCGEVMAQRAASHSMQSKANGALMRCIPLCLYTSRNMQDTIEFARRDCLLSHPNPTCVSANIAYCVALAHLLENPRDAAGAVSKAISTAQSFDSPCDQDVQDDIVSWIKGDDLDDASVFEGFVKHAFSLSFWHLKRGTSFEEAIRDVLLRGGDTDTNAAIAAAMMGAYHGIDGIPVGFVEKVIAATAGRHHRPQQYKADRIPDLVARLSV